MDSKKLPAYSDPLGVYNTLPLMPPFFFQGMTARVFPLRASPFQIDVFCNTYLNFVPEEVGRFRAFLPYVFLMVLDYGKLAAPVANIGWLSQYEIMFAVPVEWYKVKDGKWEFHNWTWLTPFIYVDSELSLLLGRQTYGWPKSLMRLTPTMSEWMNDPTSEVKRASVGAMVLPEMFVGAQQVPRIILDIHQEASILSSQIPPNFGGPFMPWIAVGNAVQTVAGVMGDMVKAMNGMGITRAHDGADPQNFMKMAQVAAAMMDPYHPDIYFNTINLKQFRDSRHPENYCYQALTNAPMRLRQFNEGGLLGDLNQLAGDASGGFKIDLYQWPGYPIVELLGLDVKRSWRGDGVDIAQVEPVFPFWYDVDMIYDRGINIAWRTFDTDWHAGGQIVEPKLGPDHKLEKRYNSTLGVSSSQTAAGVFEFTDTTARVLPLLAKMESLQEFLDAYLNRPMNNLEADAPAGAAGKKPDKLPAGATGSWFDVWGPSDAWDPGHAKERYGYVYMVATTYGPMAAAEANVGAWQSKSVQILVPVKWMQEVDGKWEMRGLGLVPAYTFTDSTEAVISGSEVLGIPTTKGVFVSPPNTWMSKTVELSAHQPLLNVSAEVLPAVDLGQQAELKQVLSIAQGPILPTSDCDSWDRMVDSPVAPLRRELTRKRETACGGGLRNARAMAIDVMANRQPWNLFTMKQFRDVEDPEIACYQSIVRIPNVIDTIYDLRELEENLHVEIREYPTLPIMRLLGLVGHLTAEQVGGGVVYKLIPVRPFWFRAKWKQDRGERMWYRCGTTAWSDPSPIAGTKDRRRPPADSYFQDAKAPEAGFGGAFGSPLAFDICPLKRLDWLLSKGDPSDLTTLLREARDAEFTDSPPLSAAEKRATVDRVDPQMIVESILSREWSSRQPDARWRERYDRLAAGLKERIETSPLAGEAKAVAEYFDDLRDQMVTRYRLQESDPAYKRLQQMYDRFVELENTFDVVEEAFDALQRMARRDAKQAASVDPAQERAKAQALLESIGRAQPGPADQLQESPAEQRRRVVLQTRVGELLVVLFEQQAAEVMRFVNQVTEAAQHHQPPPVAEPQEVLFKLCADSFHDHPERWKEIIQLLRHEREARRKSLLQMFSKTAKKPDFCVLRDIAGPLADKVFPLSECWDGVWYQGDPNEHRGEDVVARPPSADHGSDVPPAPSGGSQAPWNENYDEEVR